MAWKRFYIFALVMLLAIFGFSASITVYSLSFRPSPLNRKALHNPEFSKLEESSKSSQKSPSQKSPPLVTNKDAAAIAASCSTESSRLKVYMYDLPPEFHFGMIDNRKEGFPPWPNLTADAQPPRYPGGLYQQHSVEYWLTVDLLSSTVPYTRRSPCTASRVYDPSTADVFFVPFFSSLSYNKFRSSGTRENDQLERRLIEFLMEQPTWAKNGGRDHIIAMHHPNSLHFARSQLRKAMFVVADFGRLQQNVANVDKDVVAPYKHVISTYDNDTSSFESRETLLYFQGAIVRKEGGVIRQQLYDILNNKPGVRFLTGNTQRDGIRSATRGMRSSKFCLHPAGDTPSSNRLFDAVVSHCVPVIVSDDIELPFEDELDYSRFCVFVEAKQALRKGVLLDILNGISREEWTRKWEYLQQVDRHFEYQYPALPDDAVHMTWKAIARRLPQLRFRSHKVRRYQQEDSG